MNRIYIYIYNEHQVCHLFLYHLFLYHRKSWLKTCYHTNLATVSVWGPHLATLIHHTLLTALWQRFSCEDIFSIVLQLSLSPPNELGQNTNHQETRNSSWEFVHGMYNCITNSLYSFIFVYIDVNRNIYWDDFMGRFPNFTDFTDPLVIRCESTQPSATHEARPTTWS